AERGGAPGWPVRGGPLEGERVAVYVRRAGAAKLDRAAHEDRLIRPRVGHGGGVLRGDLNGVRRAVDGAVVDDELEDVDPEDVDHEGWVHRRRVAQRGRAPRGPRGEGPLERERVAVHVGRSEARRVGGAQTGGLRTALATGAEFWVEI